MMILLLLVSLSFLSCVGPDQQGGQGGSTLLSLLPIIAIFAVFYFLLIYPRQREQKKHARMLSELKKGDDVVTSGGIHGKVVGVKDRVVVVRIAEDCKVEIERTNITTIVKT
jgi:preprotein translocase subunit YajC